MEPTSHPASLTEGFLLPSVSEAVWIFFWKESICSDLLTVSPFKHLLRICHVPACFVPVHWIGPFKLWPLWQVKGVWSLDHSVLLALLLWASQKVTVVVTITDSNINTQLTLSLSIYSVQDMVISTWQALAHSILSVSLLGDYWYYIHFMEEKTEVYRAQAMDTLSLS